MTSPSKFYSAALEAAERIGNSLKADKPVPLKKLRELFTQYGAKSNELEWTGFDPLAKSSPNVTMTPGELVDYMREKEFKPVETVLGGGPRKPNTDPYEVIPEMLQERPEDFPLVFGRTPESYGPERLRQMTPETLEDYVGYRTMEEYARQDPYQVYSWMRQHPRSGAVPYTESGRSEQSQQGRIGALLEQYLLKPGVKYRKYNPEYKSYAGNKTETGAPTENYSEVLVRDPGEYWKPGHFRTVSERGGTLGHLRFDPREDTFRLEEVQSDLHQKGRKGGYKPRDWQEQMDEARNEYIGASDAKDQFSSSMRPFQELETLLNRYPEGGAQNVAPEARSLLRQLQEFDVDDVVERRRFIEEAYSRAASRYNELGALEGAPPKLPLDESSDWVAMLMRRALLEAAERDAPSITFPSGDVATARYWHQPQRPGEGAEVGNVGAGLWKFHEEMAPRVLDKILRQYGNEAPLRKKMGPPPRLRDFKGVYVGPEWEAPLSEGLKEKLRKRGAVPFFKEGGAVR